MQFSVPQHTGILHRTTPADQGRVERPVLTPHLRLHPLADGQALLVSEHFNTLLHGKLYGDLLPLLDGTHSQSELVARLDGVHASANVVATLESLAAKGYVVSAQHGLEAGRAAYWSSLGASPRWVEHALKGSSVAVEGGDGRFAALLEDFGVGIASRDPDLRVILCDDYLDSRFVEVNRIQLEAPAQWMLVRPGGMAPLFGPVFGRGQGDGPCWTCLTYRLRGHQEVHNFLRNHAGEAAAFKPFAAEPGVTEALYRLIASEIVKWLVLEEAAPLHEHALSISLGRFETAHHRVMRRPQCAACGDEDLRRADRPPLPVHLNSSPKIHHNSGGVRNVTPEATLAKYRHLVSPISGVVPWLTRTTDEADAWLNVYWAGSNRAISSPSLGSLRRSLRSKSAGKGSTRAQSEASALCEALERYSGTLQGDEIRIRRRLVDFSAEERALHPNQVQLFSDHQLDNAASINAKGHPYNIVPQRFDPEREVDWTPVWSLSHACHRYVPTSMLYFTEKGLGSELIADSNGCAAGNTLEEAILQGFYELVERDAFALWWYNRLRVPEVDLSRFDDEYLASAPHYYSGCDRSLWVLDVTSDLGIPTFVALSHKPDGDTQDIIYGAGTHGDPRLAVLRAVCELNQCLTWLPRSGGADGRPMIDDPLALSWWRSARVEDCAWLLPATDAPPNRASDHSLGNTTDTRDDIAACLAIIEDKGLEFLVLDQTRPDIGMPVARVLVPGLRHFWQRLAPGRLYDAPVGMGHFTEPLTESDMNPAPVIA